MTEKTIATPETAPAPAPAQAANPIAATRDARSYQAPPVDIYETEAGLTVLADLPGVAPDGVDVSVDRGVLTIVGHVAAPEADPAGLAYREFKTMDYYRQFRLPDQSDADKIEANVKQGVLRVFLPRREQVKPRKIAVNVG